MTRKNTRTVWVGGRPIGGGNPILIQSMCNTKTEDVRATVEQILRLEPDVRSSGLRCQPGRRQRP